MRHCPLDCAYAAARVVADPIRASAGSTAELDWDATIQARHRIWRTGLGVADAMDTAQRGMGLAWPVVREFITASAEAARAAAGRIVVGVGTDQLPDGEARLPAVLDAYLEQLAVAHDNDCGIVLMASRALAASATSHQDYLDVYGKVIDAAAGPVILHWLGEAFDQALHGYWGSSDIDDAATTVHELIQRHGDRIEGIKVSLLDASREVTLRRALPAGVRMYTGDDFHYVDLTAL